MTKTVDDEPPAGLGRLGLRPLGPRARRRLSSAGRSATPSTGRPSRRAGRRAVRRAERPVARHAQRAARFVRETSRTATADAGSRPCETPADSFTVMVWDLATSRRADRGRAGRRVPLPSWYGPLGRWPTLTRRRSPWCDLEPNGDIRTEPPDRPTRRAVQRDGRRPHRAARRGVVAPGSPRRRPRHHDRRIRGPR